MKIGRIFLPGLSGVALWLSALVLFIKGYKIVGLRSIDLNSNWISLHPSLADKTVLSIYKRCRKITGQFAEDMFSGKSNSGRGMILSRIVSWLCHVHLGGLDGFFPVLMFCLDSVVTLFILMVVYRFVHFLKRLPLFRQLIEYTSLTRYPFWKRYRMSEKYSLLPVRTGPQAYWIVSLELL
jgi:hypothetical protein